MDLREYTKAEYKASISYMYFLQNLVETFRLQLSSPGVAEVTRRKEQMESMLTVAKDALIEEKANSGY